MNAEQFGPTAVITVLAGVVKYLDHRNAKLQEARLADLKAENAELKKEVREMKLESAKLLLASFALEQKLSGSNSSPPPSSSHK